MRIDEIRNPILKKLVEGAKHSVGTIEADLHDALDGASNDEELIAMWQSSLESLKEEVEHYWSGLEMIKNAMPVNIEILRALVKENKRLKKEIEELNKGGEVNNVQSG